RCPISERRRPIWPHRRHKDTGKKHARLTARPRVQADRVERLCVSVSRWLVQNNASRHYEKLYRRPSTELLYGGLDHPSQRSDGTHVMAGSSASRAETASSPPRPRCSAAPRRCAFVAPCIHRYSMSGLVKGQRFERRSIRPPAERATDSAAHRKNTMRTPTSSARTPEIA